MICLTFFSNSADRRSTFEFTPMWSNIMKKKKLRTKEINLFLQYIHLLNIVAIFQRQPPKRFLVGIFLVAILFRLNIEDEFIKCWGAVSFKKYSCLSVTAFHNLDRYMLLLNYTFVVINTNAAACMQWKNKSLPQNKCGKSHFTPFILQQWFILFCCHILFIIYLKYIFNVICKLYQVNALPIAVLFY